MILDDEFQSMIDAALVNVRYPQAYDVMTNMRCYLVVLNQKG